jgi:hypothetical protein
MCMGAECFRLSVFCCRLWVSLSLRAWQLSAVLQGSGVIGKLRYTNWLCTELTRQTCSVTFNGIFNCCERVACGVLRHNCDPCLGHVAAVAVCRSLVTSPCGAKYCGCTLTTATLQWHSRRLQHWQSEGKLAETTVPGIAWLPRTEHILRPTCLLYCSSLLLLGGVKAGADRTGEDLSGFGNVCG